MHKFFHYHNYISRNFDTIILAKLNFGLLSVTCVFTELTLEC